MSEETIWQFLNDEQREVLLLFKDGRYVLGEESIFIDSLDKLHSANELVCRTLYNGGSLAVAAEALDHIVLPAFKQHIYRIMRQLTK